MQPLQKTSLFICQHNSTKLARKSRACVNVRKVGNPAYLLHTVQAAVLRSDGSGGSYGTMLSPQRPAKCQELVQNKSCLPHAATAGMTWSNWEHLISKIVSYTHTHTLAGLNICKKAPLKMSSVVREREWQDPGRRRRREEGDEGSGVLRPRVEVRLACFNSYVARQGAEGTWRVCLSKGNLR